MGLATEALVQGPELPARVVPGPVLVVLRHVRLLDAAVPELVARALWRNAWNAVHSGSNWRSVTVQFTSIYGGRCFRSTCQTPFKIHFCNKPLASRESEAMPTKVHLFSTNFVHCLCDGPIFFGPNLSFTNGDLLWALFEEGGCCLVVKTEPTERLHSEVFIQMWGMGVGGTHFEGNHFGVREFFEENRAKHPLGYLARPILPCGGRGSGDLQQVASGPVDDGATAAVVPLHRGAGRGEGSWRRRGGCRLERVGDLGLRLRGEGCPLSWCGMAVQL